MAKNIIDIQRAFKRIAADKRYVYGKWSGVGNNSVNYPSDGFHLDCTTAVCTGVREAIEGEVSTRPLTWYSWVDDGSANFDNYLVNNGFTKMPFDHQKALNSGYEVVIVIGTKHMWSYYSTSKNLQFEANDSRSNTIDIHPTVIYPDAEYMYFPTGWEKGENDMMTSKEWVNRMEIVADYPNSAYRNKYPWNLLYWDGIRWWADCVNLQKALFNGRDVYNPGVDTYQSDLSATGDCTEWGLMQQCSDVSQNFSKLKAGEPRLLYLDGHIGAYLGKEKTINKGTVNAVECTPAWENGIQYSYVDSNGGRYSYKGAPRDGSWTHHGKPTKWVKYDSTPEPAPDPGESTITLWNVCKPGTGCEGLTRTIQAILNEKDKAGLLVDGIYGDLTEAAVKKWQAKYPACGNVDGLVGRLTWTDLITRNI